MRRAPCVRGTLGVLLAGWVGSAGCTHNYYYGAVPTDAACAPGTVQYGSVCAVPAPGAGAPRVVVSSPGVRSSVVAGAPPSSAVVVSEPLNRPRLSWRRSDPDSSLATTRVEGTIEDDTTTK